MNVKQVLQFTEQLISISSISGYEREVLIAVEQFAAKKSWKVERIAVGPANWNIYIPFGRPKILLTTHLDVVPGPKEIFSPKYTDSKLIGRGACDAKGIAATMIGCADALVQEGMSDFGLLFVVEEETTGLGAILAAKHLANDGIKYLVNGEPTEGKIVTAHKGALDLSIKIGGKSCHSGYPDLGSDANKILIDLANKIYSTDFGETAELGKATVNIGLIQGGLGANVVSPEASMQICIRTVGDNLPVLDKIKELLPNSASADVRASFSLAKMIKIPGFETTTVSYCTDIPAFASLGAKTVLYGPGSIHRAHTDYEWVSESELEDALVGYSKIMNYLYDQLDRNV